MNYRIGIQILSYNKPHYLKQTLESLVTKTGPRDKICVYEQSNKEFQDECISICQQFENIHLIISDKNRGQRGATNAVFKSGFFNDCEYVMLSDHDNLFHEDLTVYCDKLSQDSSVWVATGLTN